MTKEVFIDEWIYKPRSNRKPGNEIHIQTKIDLKPFQLYVIKIYKLVVNKKEDYNELMQVMKNLRPGDRKLILDYIKKFVPGENKIKNIR